MIMAPGYPDLVKTALASDVYWSLGSVHGEAVPTDDFTALGEAIEKIRSMKNFSLAAQIGATLEATADGYKVTPIPYGSELPIPGDQEVLKVVEDSRFIYSKFSPLHWATKAAYAQSRRRCRKYIDPEFEFPTFDENLEGLYAHDLPAGPEAQAVVSYGLTKFASLRRAVLYMKYNPDAEEFSAISSAFVGMPDFWERRTLASIPQTEVGTVYEKTDRNNLGRIVSAELIEVVGIPRRYGNAPKEDNEEDRAPAKLPKFAPRLGIRPS